MKSLITIVVALFASVGFAQSAGETVDNNDKIKEVPAANHGKTVSESVKSTPNGPEKGKIVSSAARQQDLPKGQFAVTSNDKPENQYGNRPETAGRPENSGKSASAPKAQGPRVVPAMKPRPVGLNVRN